MADGHKVDVSAEKQNRDKATVTRARTKEAARNEILRKKEIEHLTKIEQNRLR